MANDKNPPLGPRGPDGKPDPNAMRPHGPAGGGERVDLEGRATVSVAATGRAGELGTGNVSRSFQTVSARGRVAGEDIATGTAPGISGADAVGASIAETIGSISTSFGNITSTATGEVRETSESRFTLLTARVAALESVRRSIDPVEPGLGHNRGPQSFEPASPEDLAEIDHFIRLLKEQTKPTAVIKQDELVKAQQETNKIAEKIREYLDIFFKELSKSLGKELGKMIPKAHVWYGLYATLGLVGAAAAAWMQTLAH